MTTADAEPQSTAPYATGGGGTVLEHRYGALLLGHLLTGDPISELGSDAAPVSVRFQASAFSPVDDLDVRGRTADGSERRVSIGVRRAPKLTGSDLASARLLASYLRVVHDDWDEVRAGRWRLGLAVISPNPAVQQVGELAVIAHGADDEAAFRAEVSRARRTTKPVRNRLVHVDALVQAAAGEAGIDLNRVSAGELTWRLLHGLRLRELRLEGADETDRSTAVGQLRRVVPDAAVVAADNLFVRLADLSGRYAPGGAHVTESLLRGDLSGTALDRSPSYAPAWRLLDGLADRLRDRIRFGLSDSSTSIELDRKEQRHAIAAAMATAAAGPGVLVVVGEPDVGKSALTLRAAETLAADGAAVTTLSLRDLPETALDFEALLGGRLTDVLSGTALAKLRLLVLDGAEVAMEGRGPLLTELTTAALRAGLGVVAITRTDGGKIVWRALRDAAATASGTTQVQQHEVLQLSPTEAATVSATFATLARLADQPRATWLLERPGLVDLLLRGDVVAALPGGALSEADVFASVWEHLVRRGNVSPPTGPTPDQRERALTSLARRLLLPVGPAEAPDAAALPSLRSDGLLLPPAQTSAWSPGEQFASDLIRDLSLTRLLIVDGFDLITQGGAPRWALRAVRLACQATLLAAPNPEETLTRLQSIFDDVAAQHGQRWAELPLEAMLTLGAAAEMLTVVWPTLLVERRAGLRTLLRLALQRYTRQGFGDAAVLGSLVALAYCGADDVGQGDRYDDGTGKQTRELVLAWLRGLVVANVDLLPLRQQVRDRILATDPVPYDEFAVEALAMLGPDLDDRATAFLKGLADVGGGHLAEAVESIGPILAMSQHQPELLIELAEAYYVRRRRDADGEHGWSMDELDDGIRSHRKTGGFGPPWAAWYYGPFFRLLNIRPQGAMAFINRMLDRAASTRVEGNQRWGATTQPAEADLPGLDLDLPGVGVRRCVGDAHVWSWYRGSSVGPYPCMSALLAVERFADQLVDTLGVPLANVAAFLLRDCHNLAMPGLVAGLIVRHLDRAGEMLDSWLARPELWHLEFSRTSTEGHFHVQGTDPPELVGRDRRRHSFRDIAAEMTLRATAAGDQQRLDTLTAIGDDLLRHARELVAGSGDDEDEIATVDGWAAAFHPENYHLRRTDGDGAVVEYEHPEDVQAALAASLAQLSRVNEALRLQMTYGRPDDRVAPVDTLIADIALARQLAEDPPVQGPLHPADPVAAVAAAAIVAHVQGRTNVPDDDLRWAARTLIEAATHPAIDGMSYASTTYALGADRSAAIGLPALLLPEFGHLALDRSEIEEAMRWCTTSLFDEVRAAFSVAVQPVWDTPCDLQTDSIAGRHQTATAAVQEGLRDCRMGGWDQTAQRRLPDPLEGPYEHTLPTVPTDSLLVNRLVAPLVAAAAAAQSSSCIAEEAKRLLKVLFEAHRRGADHWAREGYGGYNDRQRGAVARVLIEATQAGDAQPLSQYIQLFTSNARALQELLRDLALLFTYDDPLRPSLPEVWRTVMSVALDAIDAGAELLGDHHWSDYAIGGLLPTPQLDTGDADPDATLARARQAWVAPDAIADLVTRWFAIARREPKALDAVAQLARTAPLPWQTATGLSWAEDLIDGDYAAVANRCWFLTDWLDDIRPSSHPDTEATARWRRLVDGLAAEGDNRAAKLQQAEE